jgi:hypothetical protein
MMRSTIALAMMGLALGGCGEKAQTSATASGKKADAKAWEGAQAAYAAPGWKAGDKDSWEAQIKARAQQGQNEYTRSAAAPADAKTAP